MKNIKKLALIAFTTISLISCNNDDGNENPVLTLKLDHSVSVGETVTDGAGNTVTITKLRYLISDITLVKTDDTELNLSNNNAAAIVDLSEGDDGVVLKELNNIPEGEFKSVKFNVGVSEDVYNQGEEAQGALLELAQTKEQDGTDMFWAWASGYIYLKLEGSFTSNNHTDNSEEASGDGHSHVHRTEALQQNANEQTNFISHIGNTGSGETRTDRVMAVEIDFHGETVNFTNIDSSIHLAINVEKMLNATNKIDVTTFENLHTFSDVIKTNVENDVFSYSHKH